MRHLAMFHIRASITLISFLITTFVPINGIDTFSNELYLFYVSPDSGSYATGLFGGQVSPVSARLDSVGGQPVGSMRQFGFTCYEQSGRDDIRSVIADISDLRSVSFDNLTGRVLMMSDKSVLSLISVPACRTYRQQCANQSLDNIQVFLHKVPLSTTLKPGPFASHGDRLYFLLEQTDRIPEADGGRSPLVELRRVKIKCHNEFPVTSYTSTFDWLGCSEVLAVLNEQKNPNHVTYRPMDSILIVEPSIKESDKYLDVYMQMQKLSESVDGQINVTVLLYHVRVQPEDLKLPETVRPTDLPNTAEVLHQQPVSSEHVKYLLYHLGGMTFKQGHLCWTSVELILCGRVIPGGGVKEVKRVINGEEIEQICTGPDTLNTVVTGVALADVTKDQLTLYFGCWAQTGRQDIGNSLSLGGSGVARIHHGSRTRVEVLREPGVDGAVVLGSSMFLTRCGIEKATMAGVKSAEPKHLLLETSSCSRLIPTKLVLLILINIVLMI